MKLKKGVTVYKGGKKYTVEVPAGVLPEKPVVAKSAPKK